MFNEGIILVDENKEIVGTAYKQKDGDTYTEEDKWALCMCSFFNDNKVCKADGILKKAMEKKWKIIGKGDLLKLFHEHIDGTEKEMHKLMNDYRTFAEYNILEAKDNANKKD